MKIELNKRIILDQLRIDEKPVGVVDGKMVFEPNPKKAPYIVFDTKLVGFGVKVSAGRKTFVMQKKVAGRVVKAKVGDVSDFAKLEDARTKATELSLSIRQTGSNPNAERRRLIASEITLGDAMARYLTHLKNRKNPATENTIKGFERSERKLSFWKGRRVKSLASDEIKEKFDELAATARTATEQTFRWASVSVEHVLSLEAVNAQSEGRQPGLLANPFKTLVHLGCYRTRAELETEWEKNRMRKPMDLAEVGRFLEALWAKRFVNDNDTGCDFILLMLLWGCRKSEHAGLVWREILAPEGREPKSPQDDPFKVSWLDLSEGALRFHKTKNQRPHKLPLGPCAQKLLQMRQAAQSERWANKEGFVKKRRFVFPAQSEASKAGHYVNSNDLLERLADEAGLPGITQHDIRRTFGQIAQNHAALPPHLVKRLLNHANGDVTDRYTQAEWGMVKEAITKVEEIILKAAPNVWNALRPDGAEELPAPEPHQLKPTRPRPGRPRKQLAGGEV